MMRVLPGGWPDLHGFSLKRWEIGGTRRTHDEHTHTKDTNRFLSLARSTNPIES